MRMWQPPGQVVGGDTDKCSGRGRKRSDAFWMIVVDSFSVCNTFVILGRHGWRNVSVAGKTDITSSMIFCAFDTVAASGTGVTSYFPAAAYDQWA